MKTLGIESEGSGVGHAWFWALANQPVQFCQNLNFLIYKIGIKWNNTQKVLSTVPKTFYFIFLQFLSSTVYFAAWNLSDSMSL